MDVWRTGRQRLTKGKEESTDVPRRKSVGTVRESREAQQKNDHPEQGVLLKMGEETL